MIITPIAWDKNNKPTMYKSGPVYTNVNGYRIWVSDGYTEPSVLRIIWLAINNADIRRRIYLLGSKFRIY